MRGILKLLCFFVFVHQIPAQILENHFYGNTKGADLLPGHLVAMEDGGALITGKSNTQDTGGYHVLLIRTDSLGDVLWQRTYHQGSGNWVCKALDGGFVVGGSSDRHLFGPQQGFVLKVNESGVEEWKQYLPVGNHSFVSVVVPLSSGNMAVCGVMVNEGVNASQKAFWSILDAGGSLIEYQTVDNYETIYRSTPNIVETKDSNLILGWAIPHHNMLRCFTPNGQIIWEHDLTEEFQYEFGREKSLLIDSIGDLWVAGGGRLGYAREILHFSSNGNLKQRIEHDQLIGYPAALFSGQNGTVNYWFPKYFGLNIGGTLIHYPKGFIKLKFSNEGTILTRDSIIFDSYRFINSIAEINETRLLLLDEMPFYKGNIQILPIQKSTTDYQAQDPWVFSSGPPYSHDLYEAHCKSLSGGEFVLTRGDSKSSELLQLGYYVLRINENNQELARTYLGDWASSQGGQIQPTTDGGAVALGSNGLAWKLDTRANLIWSKPVKSGKLFSGPNNDFFIVESKSQPGIYDPIRIYHFNSAGDSVSVSNVYSRSQHYYLAGGVSQVGNGPMLFANKYFESDGRWHNWLIYLDKEGKFVSELLLDSSNSRTSFSNSIIQTSDGGTLIASHHYSTQGIYMMHVKDGELLWSTNIFGSDPDSIYLDLISIEEVPCKGYVLAFESNLIHTNTPSTKLMLLYYIDKNGQGKDFYTYNPLLGLVMPDTSFLPGYTFRRWDYQLNGQTYDILLQTVHFQDTSHVTIPQGQLVIMPNPSGEEICLHYESSSYGILNIEVFNASGQRVDRFKSEKTSSDWRLHYQANYPAGMYFIQITNGEKERVVRRWVKGL